jgi:hypothetical protein
MPNIKQSQINQLTDTLPELHQVITALKGVVHPDILKKLENIKKNINDAMQPFTEAEDKAIEDEIEQYGKIQEKLKFCSIWSIRINPKKLSTQFSKKIVKSVHYKDYNLSIQCNKKMTWMDMWAIGEHLINLSKDSHHIFIEDFREISNGHYELITGS